MARPRKPTKVLELNGAFENHPNRRADREREPKPVLGLGAAPEGFDEAERARWDELVEICAPGVLTQQDRVAAEALCRLWAQFRRRDPLKVQELSLMVQLIGRFGMTPSDRSKVLADPGEEENDKARFFA